MVVVLELESYCHLAPSDSILAGILRRQLKDWNIVHLSSVTPDETHSVTLHFEKCSVKEWVTPGVTRDAEHHIKPTNKKIQ